jgi:hypothetical protein
VIGTAGLIEDESMVLAPVRINNIRRFRREVCAMSDLVERLQTEQPIVASLRPEPTVEALRAAVDRGVVHVKFVNTRGGTELGVRLDRDASDLAGLDGAQGRGTIRLVGTLTLDFVPVRFEGVLALDTLQGTGSLKRASAAARA